MLYVQNSSPKKSYYHQTWGESLTTIMVSQKYSHSQMLSFCSCRDAKVHMAEHGTVTVLTNLEMTDYR